MEQKQKTVKSPSFGKVLQKSALSCWAMAPMLLGVMGLVGIFQVLVTPKMLASLFSGNFMVDTFIGTLAGAVAAGNPMISYLLGGELLDQGISSYAVTAFILSWVTLGFIQLPAEIEVFGFRFTVLRNLFALIFTILIAVATSLTVKVLV